MQSRHLYNVLAKGAPQWLFDSRLRFNSVNFRFAWLPLSLTLLSVAAHAATDVGMVTLVEGGTRLLRGTTWFKLVAGARVEDGDIIEAADRAQAQVEFAGTAVNLAGPGSIYFNPAPEKSGAMMLTVAGGWCKVAVVPPGLRLRAAPADVVVSDAVMVVRVAAPAAGWFIEAGSGKLIEATVTGADGPAHAVKRGEYWTRTASGVFTMAPRAAKAFVDDMPRHFTDALPSLAAKFKSKPQLVVEREITFTEAEPWLAGRDRARFERRFAGRLRDPTFRRAAEPNLARYPMWDRMLHPEKYEPKPVSPK